MRTQAPALKAGERSRRLAGRRFEGGGVRPEPLGAGALIGAMGPSSLRQGYRTAALETAAGFD
jgi:hypothetical protein